MPTFPPQVATNSPLTRRAHNGAKLSLMHNMTWLLWDTVSVHILFRLFAKSTLKFQHENQAVRLRKRSDQRSVTFG